MGHVMEESGTVKGTYPLRRHKLDWSVAAALLTAVVLLAATFLSWHSVRNHQNNHLAEQAREKIEFLAARLDAHVKLRIALGALIEEEWRNGLISDADTFGLLASTKLNFFDDLQAINWVSPDGIIRWVNPLAGNRAVLDLDLRQLKIPAQTLALSERERDIQITPPITLAQGGRGFVVYMPLFIDDTLEGFVNIVFRTAPMIENALPKDFSARMHIRITDDGAEAFSSTPETINADNAAHATIQLHNRTWTLTGALTAAETAKLNSFLAEWVLLAGLIVTLFMSYLVWLTMQHHYSIQSGERRFADFADVSSDWFWETDSKLRFSYFSDRFEDITGVAPGALLGRTREQTGAPGSDPKAYAEMLQCLRDRKPFRDFENQRVKPNGETAYLAISGKPAFGQNGKFIGFRGTGRDITDERRSREALNRALIESEQVNQSKSEFLATISHEFRTPLNAILGFSEMFRAQYFGPLGSEKYAQYADDIHNSGKHMLALINDILDISAIEARKRPLHFEAIEISEIANDCARNFEYQCRKKNLTLSVDIPTTLPSFDADKRALVQILLNLMSNAVKFTEPGGAIVVSARVLNGDMVITVNDNGIGIAEDKLSRIAEPFFQTNSNPHIAQEGTGLGLSIITLLIEAHGGSLDIKSQLGKGSTVTVRLPMSRLG
tara:strand:+ start:21831 stop:23831 length:2001 start_codon:yes stop_codon:yes gene_type:complete